VKAVASHVIPEHVRLNGIAFDDHRFVYVPVPKAASTSILSVLADLAGMSPEDRLGSRKLEVILATTVHDGAVWDPSYRLRARSETEFESMFGSDEWFSFTVVREPVRRLWSAWVTKVLVRDPRFVVGMVEDLFPAPPASAGDVVESFRRFVSGLPHRPDWSDTHWSSQVELAGIPGVSYTHVGRVEHLEETTAELRRHLTPRDVVLPALPVENRSFLPFAAGLFDRTAHDACTEWTARDRDAFGYEPLSYAGGRPDAAWYEKVESIIPALRAIIDRNERFLDLWRLQEDPDAPRHHVRRAHVAVGLAAAASVSALLAGIRHS